MMAKPGTITIPVRLVLDQETRQLLETTANHLDWVATQGMEGADTAEDLAGEIRNLLQDIEAEVARPLPEPQLDPLTPYERSTLDQHEEDGNGGCIICRQWDRGTYDDEETHSIVAWPCHFVRLARLIGALPDRPEPALTVERLATMLQGMRLEGISYDEMARRILRPLDVERLTRALGSIDFGYWEDRIFHSPEDRVQLAKVIAAEYLRLSQPPVPATAHEEER